MKNCPMRGGTDVPKERRRRKSDVLPGKKRWAIEEKRNAESPNPDITRPVTVARFVRS